MFKNINGLSFDLLSRLVNESVFIDIICQRVEYHPYHHSDSEYSHPNCKYFRYFCKQEMYLSSCEAHPYENITITLHLSTNIKYPQQQIHPLAAV